MTMSRSSFLPRDSIGTDGGRSGACSWSSSRSFWYQMERVEDSSWKCLLVFKQSNSRDQSKKGRYHELGEEIRTCSRAMISSTVECSIIQVQISRITANLLVFRLEDILYRILMNSVEPVRDFFQLKCCGDRQYPAWRSLIRISDSWPLGNTVQCVTWVRVRRLETHKTTRMKQTAVLSTKCYPFRKSWSYKQDSYNYVLAINNQWNQLNRRTVMMPGCWLEVKAVVPL